MSLKQIVSAVSYVTAKCTRNSNYSAKVLSSIDVTSAHI